MHLVAIMEVWVARIELGRHLQHGIIEIGIVGIMNCLCLHSTMAWSRLRGGWRSSHHWQVRRWSSHLWHMRRLQRSWTAENWHLSWSRSWCWGPWHRSFGLHLLLEDLELHHLLLLLGGIQQLGSDSERCWASRHGHRRKVARQWCWGLPLPWKSHCLICRRLYESMKLNQLS